MGPIVPQPALPPQAGSQSQEVGVKFLPGHKAGLGANKRDGDRVNRADSMEAGRPGGAFTSLLELL